MKQNQPQKMRLVISIIIGLSIASCRNASSVDTTVSVDEIEHYTMLELDSSIIDLRSHVIDNDDFDGKRVLYFDVLNPLKLDSTITASPMYNMKVSNEECRDSLLKYKVTGYWIQTQYGYEFHEPQIDFDKPINSLLFSENDYSIKSFYYIDSLKFQYYFIDL